MRTVTRVMVIYRHPAASVIVGRLVADKWQVAQRADRTGAVLSALPGVLVLGHSHTFVQTQQSPNNINHSKNH